jgi:HD-like signal output (HDOD) protein
MKLQNITPDVLVQGVVGLVSLPEICIRISEMVDNPRSNSAAMGKIISQDAALTARLLKIVNSAFYRFPSRVETVTRAITIVGNRELRDLVLAATVSGIFEKISSDLVDIDLFWRHGLYTGILSRNIAEKCHVLHSERLFVAGLMHNIGQLIIAYKLPKYYRAALMMAEEQGIPVYEAENAVFGFNHADVGAELMKSWSFPESHQFVARFHHQPEYAHAFKLETAIVNVAETMSQMAENGEANFDYLKQVDRSTRRLVNLTSADVEQLLLDAREQFIEVLSLFRPRNKVTTHYAA